MKKITFFSLIAATLLFTACGEETKKAETEATETTTEAVKKDTQNAMDAAKTKSAEVAEAAKIEAEKIAAAAEELMVAAEAKATEAAAAVEAKAEEVTADVTPETPESPEAYAKCKACHGADGKTKALGKSAVIAGQDKAALITSMNEYKAGTKNVAGMGMLMKGQVASMSDEDIEAVAEYLSQI